MIICFAGRKGSGKTLLANELVKRGFIKISFADRLREIISKLFLWSLEELYDPLKKEEKFDIPIEWSEQKYLELIQILGVDTKIKFVPQKFFSKRDILQFIGTDIIRKINPNFHVDELAKKIDQNPNINFVLDDVRFPDELTLMEKFGAFSFFIIRPYNRNYSNHRSEVSLRWANFDYLILNDGSQDKLTRKANMMFDSLLRNPQEWIKNHQFWKNILIKHNWNTSEVAITLKCSRDKVVWWSTKLCLNILRNTYDYDHSCFSIINEESSYWAGLLSADGSIKIEPNKELELTSIDLELIEGFQKFLKTKKKYYKVYKNEQAPCYQLHVHSPYIMEDLKLWNLEPNKSKNNVIPECIKDNDRLLSYWICGLIDGDGSIYLQNNKYLNIAILASESIIDFIKEKFKDIPSKKQSEKNIPNLFNLKFNGKNALTFYKRVFKGVGLSRKWNKTLPFIKEQVSR